MGELIPDRHGLDKVLHPFDRRVEAARRAAGAAYYDAGLTMRQAIESAGIDVYEEDGDRFCLRLPTGQSGAWVTTMTPTQASRWMLTGFRRTRWRLVC